MCESLLNISTYMPVRKTTSADIKEFTVTFGEFEYNGVFFEIGCNDIPKSVMISERSSVIRRAIEIKNVSEIDECKEQFTHLVIKYTAGPYPSKFGRYAEQIVEKYEKIKTFTFDKRTLFLIKYTPPSIKKIVIVSNTIPDEFKDKIFIPDHIEEITVITHEHFAKCGDDILKYIIDNLPVSLKYLEIESFMLELYNSDVDFSNIVPTVEKILIRTVKRGVEMTDSIRDSILKRFPAPFFDDSGESKIVEIV